jgi:nucleoside-diphosphate-sugar epimerase
VTGRVVIFGGSGFIGSAILRHLDDAAVAPPRRDADLNDMGQLMSVLRRGDIVINAAGWAQATDRSAASLSRLKRDNVQGPVCLAQAAAEAGAAQLVHISSVAAMAAPGDASRSPYAHSKLVAEERLRGLVTRPPLTILRPTSVFGEGRGLARTLCRLASLPVIPLPAGGTALIPFTYVDNVAYAVRLAIGNENCLERAFVVGDAESYTLRSIVQGLAGAMGRRPRFISVPVSVVNVVARGESLMSRLRGRPPLLDRQRVGTLTTSAVYSIADFQAASGYEPLVPMEEAVRRIGRWFRAEARG